MNKYPIFLLAVVSLCCLTIWGCGREEQKPMTQASPNPSTLSPTVNPITEARVTGPATAPMITPSVPTNLMTMPTPPTLDFSRLIEMFQSSDANTKNKVQSSMDAVRARNYPAALRVLQEVMAQSRLTPDQTQTVRDVIAQIQSLTPTP